MSESKGKNTPNAYMIWLNGGERQKIAEAGFAGKEVMKEAGRRWREMSDAAKKPYQDQSDKLKAEKGKGGVKGGKRVSAEQ